MEVVRIENLTKVYGRGDAQTLALIDANLSVEGGELVALLGPSGSGKTTLLTSICCRHMVASSWTALPSSMRAGPALTCAR